MTAALFWMALALGAGLVALWIVRPLIKARAPLDLGTTRAESYGEALAALDRDRAAAMIETGAAESERAALGRALLAELDDPAAQPIVPDAGAHQAGPRRRAAFALLALLPVAGLLLYLAVGAPQFVGDTPAAEEVRQMGELRALVGKVERRVAQNPADAEGYVALAMGLSGLGRFSEAAEAYARAIALGERSAELYASLGEMRVLASEGYTQEALAAFAEALALDPRNAKALLYQAEAFARGGNLEGAIKNWALLRDMARADSPAARELDQRIAAARAEIGRAPALDSDALAAAEGMNEEERSAFIEGMLNRLEARLAETPDDLAGWERLIRARQVRGETTKADEALARARRHFAADAAAMARLSALDAPTTGQPASEGGNSNRAAEPRDR